MGCRDKVHTIEHFQYSLSSYKENICKCKYLERIS